MNTQQSHKNKYIVIILQKKIYSWKLDKLYPTFSSFFSVVVLAPNATVTTEFDFRSFISFFKLKIIYFVTMATQKKVEKKIKKIIN